VAFTLEMDEGSVMDGVPLKEMVRKVKEKHVLDF
jgi:hypothetical protein